MKSLWLALGLITFSLPPAQAGVIDFEQFGAGDLDTPIATDDISVTVSCGAAPGAANCRTFIYGVPALVFAPSATPADPFGPGTDLGVTALTNGPSDTPVPTDDFFLQFSAPIIALSLDAIDLEFAGFTHVLSLFANADFTDVVGFVSFTVPGNAIDADTTSFSVVLAGATALSARFTSEGDPGLALDNIIATAAQVPEPGPLGALALGLFALAIGLDRTWLQRGKKGKHAST